MKGTAAAALVIMGAILILAPAIMDYLYQLNAAQVAVRLSSGYRIFMIAFGTLMVFIGVGMGFTALERGPRA